MEILYNVTVSVDENIVEEWKSWMIDIHIPDVMKTACFTSYQMQQIMSGEHTNGVTFAIQYTAPNKAAFEKYTAQYAPRLQKEHTERYKGKYAAFRTIMNIISKG